MRFGVLALLVVLGGCASHVPHGPSVDMSKMPAVIPPDKIVMVGKDGTPIMVDCPAAPDPATLKIEPLQVPPPPPKGQHVTPGKAIKVVPPAFPTCSEARAVSGIADFAFTVEPDGSVADIKVLQEVPAGFGFADAARAVLPQWQYQPRIVDGKPVAYAVTYRFTMRHVEPDAATKEQEEKALQNTQRVMEMMSSHRKTRKYVCEENFAYGESTCQRNRETQQE